MSFSRFWLKTSDVCIYMFICKNLAYIRLLPPNLVLIRRSSRNTGQDGKETQLYARVGFDKKDAQRRPKMSQVTPKVCIETHKDAIVMPQEMLQVFIEM